MEDTISAFVSIAAAMFVTELTDKDALLLLALASRTRAALVFLAGSSAFVLTTVVNVGIGALATSFVPLAWIKVAGGSVMVAYGLWEAKGLIGKKLIEEEERRLEKERGPLRAFLGMVGALVLLDLAGDATQVLTIVFVAHYSDTVLVFVATCLGLIAATGLETALGNRLGRLLTPERLRFVSVVVFLALGSFIVITSAM